MKERDREIQLSILADQRWPPEPLSEVDSLPHHSVFHRWGRVLQPPSIICVALRVSHGLHPSKWGIVAAEGSAMPGV